MLERQPPAEAMAFQRTPAAVAANAPLRPHA
jgi:hypothetical protein